MTHDCQQMICAADAEPVLVRDGDRWVCLCCGETVEQLESSESVEADE